MKWLKDMVSFDHMDDDREPGMMLSDAHTYGGGFSNDWGENKSEHRVSCCCYEGRDYCRDHSDARDTSTYEASFLLAYDTASEPELKCLSGIKGVAEIAKQVVATNDYDLLNRLLSVVERKKNKAKLGRVSCCSLLQLMNTNTKAERSDSARIDIVNRIILGLSPSQEPNTNLFTAISKSVKKFGWENLSDSVTNLLTDDARKQCTDPRSNKKSRITLKYFYGRIYFIFWMANNIKNPTLSEEEITRLVDSCIADLEKSDNTDDIANLPRFITNIDTKLINKRGWEATARVFESSLAFIRKNASPMKLPSLMSIADLLLKLQSSGHDMNCHLANLSVDFTVGIIKFGNQQEVQSHLSGANQGHFLKCIQILIQYGKQKELDDFGKWFISREDVFSSIVTSIANATIDGFDNEDLLRVILNNCLIQRSIPSTGGWDKHKDANGRVSPSLHVRQVLTACPHVAHQTDEVGRLPLHHAADSFLSAYDTIMDILHSNQEAASVSDPVSRLYPFMLAAGSNAEAAVDSPVESPSDEADGNVWKCHECTYDNEDANVKTCRMCSEPNPNYKRRKPFHWNCGISISFRLLLTNPSLLRHATETDTLKRKRSFSMDNNISDIYETGIFAAIGALADRTGSSATSIKNHMQANFPKDTTWMNTTYLNALKNAVDNGELTEVIAVDDEISQSDTSYKLSPAYKAKNVNREVSIVKYISIEGCGTPGINGVYTKATQSCEGSPLYYKKGKYNDESVNYIIFCRVYGSLKFWLIGLSGKATFFYRSVRGMACDGSVTLPPLSQSGWVTKDNGASPLPQLKYMCTKSVQYVPVRASTNSGD